MRRVVYKKRYVEDGVGHGSSLRSQYENIHRNWCGNALTSGNENFPGDDLLSIFSSCSIGFPVENRSLPCGECSGSAQPNRRAVSNNGDRLNEETAVKSLFSPTPELLADNSEVEDPILQQLIQGVFRARENVRTNQVSENIRSNQASENRSAVSTNGSRRNEKTAVNGFPELSAYNGTDHALHQLIQNVFRESGNVTGSQNQNCRQSTSFNAGRLCSEDRKTFTLLEQNLNAIIRNFKKCQESCLRFLSVYDEWSRSRRRTIAELTEIAEDLGIVKSNCNVATVTGHSVGSAGTIITIAGTTVVAVATGPVGAALAAVGFAVGMAGGFTCLGTSIARTKVQHTKIRKAQEIYEKDKEKFLVMTEWFKHCCTYQEAIKELMDFDVFQNILTDTKNFVSHFIPEGCRGKYQGQDLTIMATRFFLSILKDSGIEDSFVMTILTNSNLREILKELMRLHHENLVVFEGIAMTAKVFSFISVAKGIDMVDDIATTIATKTATSAGRAVGSSVGKVAVQGVLLGISLAIDLTGLVLTSIEIQKASKCPGEERISEAVEKLADEYYHLRKVYGALQKYERSTVSVRVFDGTGGLPIMQ